MCRRAFFSCQPSFRRSRLLRVPLVLVSLPSTRFASFFTCFGGKKKDRRHTYVEINRTRSSSYLLLVDTPPLLYRCFCAGGSFFVEGLLVASGERGVLAAPSRKTLVLSTSDARKSGLGSPLPTSCTDFCGLKIIPLKSCTNTSAKFFSQKDTAPSSVSQIRL